MPLTPGTRLGVYEIVRALGSGGMGDVFCALDAKLGREIALKLLPDAVSEDPERRARLEREAKLLAQLNHPGIATLHGLEEIDGRLLLAMELVEGETLRERIARGPIPWEEAVALFVQIADALEAAHAKGILHRDLKPANVQITPEGRVKLLDFGLAKAFQIESESPDSSQSPTLTRETEIGVLLGTASYMSPEQARGKAIDRRSDIWAFGCCLYEALTRKKAFEGETVTDTLAAVVNGAPDFDRLPTGTPVAIRRLLKRALTKDRNRRLRDAGDLRLELEDVEEAVPETLAPRRRGWWIAAVVLAALAGGVAVRFFGEASSTPDSTRRLSIVIPPELELDVGPFYHLALSSDGSQLVYPAADASGTSRLYHRRLDRFETIPIPGTEGGTSPFFSPDGRWLGFHARGTLHKVALDGGAPVAVAPLPSGFIGASWDRDGTVIADTAYAAQGLLRIRPSGDVETLEATAVNDGARIICRSPFALPQRESFLCESFALPDIYHIGAVDARTGTWQAILRGGSWLARPRYLAPGYLVYAEPTSGALFAVELDAKTGRTRGIPARVVDRVLGHYDGVHFDVSANGVLAYVPGGAGGLATRLVWVDRRGATVPITNEPGYFQDPRISPDGRWLAVGDSVDLRPWIYDLDGGGRRPLMDDRGPMPVWSPDGTEILFGGLTLAEPALFLKPAFSDAPARKIIGGDHLRFPTTWSRDGAIGFYELHPITGRDVWVKPGNGDPVLIAGTSASERSPWFSPDGRFLAYVSDESGKASVYVVPYPPTGAKWLASPDGGEEPVWSRDGRELFYRRGRAMIARSVAVTSDGLSFGPPQVLFEGRFEVTTGGRSQNYGVAPDGRFVMIQRVDAESPREIRVVLNWKGELEVLLSRR